MAGAEWMAEQPGILVAGDVVTDHCLYQGRRRRPFSRLRLGTSQTATPGGAALLAAFMEAVGRRLEPGVAVRRGFRDLGAASAARSYCLLGPYPGPRGEVWRVAEALGFDEGLPQCPEGGEDAEALAAPYDVVVLDDAGAAFRRWPSARAWPRFLLDPGVPPPRWLVLKLAHPLAAGDLWHTIRSGATQHRAPLRVSEPGEWTRRAVAVLSVQDLRAEAVAVSRGLSWERTAFDLIHELRHNPDLDGLRTLRYVIVNLESEAALLAAFPEDEPPTFRLVFDPGSREGAFRGDTAGGAYGYQSCLTAAVAARLAAPRRASDPAQLDGSAGDGDMTVALERGIIDGLCGMRRLLLEGHGPVGSEPALPFAAVAGEITASQHGWSYGSAGLPADRPRSTAWTIIAGDPDVAGAVPLFGLARRVALSGVHELKRTPYVQCGGLFSVERTEIESIRTLEALLRNYQEDAKATRPLSLAVFGPPGAGKSFGVKELSRSVFGKDVPLLEFNLSQFGDASELNGLFHQVRDAVLRGRMPVVFWDEFDSRALHWLQYLLAPMQDGAFQEGQITHPIGKCVFVFAGGTRHRFEDFGVPPPELEGDRHRQDDWKRDFTAKKGPDFKSRLAGYLNVLGPNPRDAADVSFPVRRALLLRFLLGIKLTDRLLIDRGLLTAFLSIDRYRHGSRSLEKIAEQVRLARGTRLESTRSDLPPREQLDLHVDAETFLRLLERD